MERRESCVELSLLNTRIHDVRVASKYSRVVGLEALRYRFTQKLDASQRA